MRISHIFLALLAALVFQACSDNPQKKSARATAEAFLTALAANDFDRAKSLCTESSRSKLALFESMSKMDNSAFLKGPEIVREEASGDYATVYYTTEDERGEKVVRLRNVTGQWEVMANKADFSGTGEDNDLDLDLDETDVEELAENMVEGLASGLEELSEGLENMGEELEDEVEEVGEAAGRLAEKFSGVRRGKNERETAEAFLTALKYADYEGAKKYASEKTADVLDMQSSLGSSKSHGEFDILRSKVEEPYATVYYRDLETQSEKLLKLKRDDQGNWEVIMAKQDFNALDED